MAGKVTAKLVVEIQEIQESHDRAVLDDSISVRVTALLYEFIYFYL
jgi:hypothetical protein